MISFGRAPCDEGVIRAAAETSGCAERARPWVLAATILGSSMAFIDGSVVTVALPAIQADLATSVAGAQWVANAYTLMLGALIHGAINSACRIIERVVAVSFRGHGRAGQRLRSLR